MLVKVISKDGKMYTLPDKLTTKPPEGMTEEEKVEFLDAIKNVNITNLNDGASNGLAKVAVTEQKLNKTRRTDVELQGFDFLFVSILPSRGNADITQSSAIIENLKYIN